MSDIRGAIVDLVGEKRQYGAEIAGFRERSAALEALNENFSPGPELTAARMAVVAWAGAEAYDEYVRIKDLVQATELKDILLAGKVLPAYDHDTGEKLNMPTSIMLHAFIPSGFFGGSAGQRQERLFNEGTVQTLQSCAAIDSHNPTGGGDYLADPWQGLHMYGYLSTETGLDDTAKTAKMLKEIADGSAMSIAYGPPESGSFWFDNAMFVNRLERNDGSIDGTRYTDPALTHPFVGVFSVQDFLEQLHKTELIPSDQVVVSALFAALRSKVEGYVSETKNRRHTYEKLDYLALQASGIGEAGMGQFTKTGVSEVMSVAIQEWAADTSTILSELSA